MDIPTDLWGQIALEGASVYINDNTRFTTVRSQEEKFCQEVFSLLGFGLGGVDQEDSYYTHKYRGSFIVSVAAVVFEFILPRCVFCSVVDQTA